MKTKEKYIEPAIEVIDMEMEEIIATSGQGGSSVNVDDSGSYDGQAGARKRLWD